MNDEDKIIRNKHILNNTKKRFQESTALVLRNETWVVASCGCVTSCRRLEHRYRLHPEGCEKTHNRQDEDPIFLSKRRKVNTQQYGATTQKAFFANTPARIQVR